MKTEKTMKKMTGAVILILAGIVVLIASTVESISFGALWPLFMLIPVVTMLFQWERKSKKNASLVIPITILTVLTVYFLWMNITGWEKMAQSWPIFILAPGLGLLISYFFSKSKETLHSACVLIGIALIAYVIGGVIAVNISIVVGIGLIVAGTVILVFNRKKAKGVSNEKDDSA